MPPEHFSVSGVEGNHLSVIWAGWGDRRLEKTANRHGENFLFAFLNEKKKVFEMLFIILRTFSILPNVIAPFVLTKIFLYCIIKSTILFIEGDKK